MSSAPSSQWGMEPICPSFWRTGYRLGFWVLRQDRLHSPKPARTLVSSTYYVLQYYLRTIQGDNGDDESFLSLRKMSAASALELQWIQLEREDLTPPPRCGAISVSDSLIPPTVRASASRFRPVGRMNEKKTVAIKEDLLSWLPIVEEEPLDRVRKLFHVV